MVRIKNLFLILIILFSIISINYNVVAYNQARANSYIIGDNSQITGFPNGGGDVYNLAILIRFQDQEPMSKEKIEEVNKSFNDDKGWSLNTFYNAYTYRKGSCKTFIGPYVNGSISEYVDNEERYYYTYGGYRKVEYSETEDDFIEYELYTYWNHYSRELELYTNVIKYVSENLPPEMDVNDLDKNNDGVVDNITFVIDGQEESWGQLLWPQKSSFNDVIVGLEKIVDEMKNQGDNEGYKEYKEYLKENSNITIKNKKVNTYNVIFADNIKNTVSTVAHEFMHVFGYIDNYDYNDQNAQRTLRI